MFLYTCVKYEGTKLTNAVSNNINPLITINTTSPVAAESTNTAAVESFEMSKAAADEFSSSIANTSAAISNVDAQINAATDATTKQELKTRKEELLARKKELQNKKTALKNRMSQLKSEIAAYQADTEGVRTELSRLKANKASVEKTVQNENKEISAKNEKLTQVNGKIDATKAELEDTINSLNKSVQDLTKQASDELNAQRKTVSLATSEAMELVQNGELKSEDMPSYIAGKLANFTSVGNTSLGSMIVDSNNTKIKSLCSQLAGYINNQGSIQLGIKASSSKLQLVSPLLESLDSKIQGKSAELQASESFLTSRQSEMDSVANEYTNSDMEITDIDTEVASINTQIIEDATVIPQTEATAETQAAPQYSQFFMTGKGVSGIEINIEDEISKITAKTNQILTEEVKNSEIDTLKSKMTEADKLITTLRSHLSDTAQKIIEERLEATKRR